MRGTPFLAALFAALTCGSIFSGCGGNKSGQGTDSGGGGHLIASLNSDPQTFNRLVAADYASAAVADLLSGDLVHIDRSTFELVPSLASGWDLDEDGRTYTLHLRPGLRFSDGSPCTIDDVLFTLQAIRDMKPGSIMSEQLIVDGVFPAFERVDDNTLRISFPRPLGVGLRGLDSLSILPRNRLHEVSEQGMLSRAWDATTPPEEVVGMGPFRLKEHQRGVKVVLERNPYYWRKDSEGRPLPYLDRITFLIIPDRNTEALRFQAGDLDIVQTLDSENYARLRRAAGARETRVEDLGPGLQFDFLWFNLNRGRTRSGKPVVEPEKLSVFERAEFRQAVSVALDRPSMARTILLGLGTAQYGPVSPGNKTWHHPALPRSEYDPQRARELLKTIGLEDSNGDGVLDLGSGRPLEFTVLTSRGIQHREKIAQVIRDQLSRVGMRVNIQSLDPNDLITRIRSSFDYEAMLFGFTPNDVVPDSMVTVWYSSGSNHFWNPGQPVPATAWEGEIDSLIGKLVRTIDSGERERIFYRVQEIWCREMPAIPTLSSNVLVAWKSRVKNVRPSILRPQLWWNADELAVQDR